MGKRTKFHPVGLHVIRGGLEFTGWKVGRLRQIYYKEADNAALYETEILDRPAVTKDSFFQDWPQLMSQAFAADVTVTKVWSNRNGKLFCEIATHTYQPTQTTVQA